MNGFESPSDLTIFLVRAGSTELDDQGRISGSLDMPLSQTGEQEACQTADELSFFEFDAIYSASCLAAQQTAKKLGEQWNVRVKTIDSWTNLDHGLWHGKSLDELKETQPRLYRQWQENPESICPPGGETIDSVRQRIVSGLKKIRRKFKTATIAIVAPDPLYGIIRSEIDCSQVRELLHPRSDCLGWEKVKPPVESTVS